MQRTTTTRHSLAAAALFVLLAACSTNSTTNSATETTTGAPASVETAADSTTVDTVPYDETMELPTIQQPTTTAPAAGDTLPSPAPETPAPPSTFAPVELTAVEDPAPIPAPPAPANPVDLMATPVVINDLVGNAPGCASNCITSAVLSPGALATPVSIAVETNVNTRMTLWMSTQSITTVDGIPSFPGNPSPVATSGIFRRVWNATIEDLTPNQRYRAILRVRDHYGNERFLTAEIRTPHGQPSNDLAATGGCAYQCITMGVVQPTVDFDRVNLVVATNVPARLAVYVSTTEPGYIGESPVLPAEALIDTPPSINGDDLGTNWSIPVDGLEGDTVYHVIVKAQDADGDIAHRVGQFRTAHEPLTEVRITIERIYLANDGDPGDANRGEVYFMWGLMSQLANGVYNPWREDTGFELVPDYNEQYRISVNSDTALPRFGATVWEMDWDGQNEPSCWDIYNFVTVDGTRFIEMCDARGNGVYSEPMTLDDLAELPRCSTYGFIAGEDNACHLLSTTGGTENYAQIKVLISYEIL